MGGFCKQQALAGKLAFKAVKVDTMILETSGQTFKTTVSMAASKRLSRA